MCLCACVRVRMRVIRVYVCVYVSMRRQVVPSDDVRAGGPPLAAQQSPGVGSVGRGFHVLGCGGHEQVRHQQTEGSVWTTVSVCVCE